MTQRGRSHWFRPTKEPQICGNVRRVLNLQSEEIRTQHVYQCFYLQIYSEAIVSGTHIIAHDLIIFPFKTHCVLKKIETLKSSFLWKSSLKKSCIVPRTSIQYLYESLLEIANWQKKKYNLENSVEQKRNQLWWCSFWTWKCISSVRENNIKCY